MPPRTGFGRQSALVAVGFLAAALICTWPIVRDATRSLPGDAGDSLLNAWTIGWIADRLRHGLAGVWTAPNFFPYRNTLAFSEHLLGIAPAVAPIVWATGNPLLAYNAAFVASFALAGIGMYVLAQHLTGNRLAAWATGLAFALAPARLAQVGHLQVLMSGWIPLALWALHRYVDSAQRKWLAAFAAFVLVVDLSNSYFVYFLALPIAFVALHGVASAGARRARLIAGLCGAAAAILIAMAPIAMIYFDVRHEYGLRRAEDDVINYGADLGSYLRGNDGVPHIIEPWRRLPNAVKPVGPEGQLFPGAAVLALAAFGLIVAWRGRDPRARWGRLYSGILLAAVWLSMGLYPTVWGVHVPIGGPYGLLFRHFPGFDGIRVPARLSIDMLVAADVLAAIGLAWLLGKTSRRTGAALTAAAIVTIGLEGIPVPLPTAFVALHGQIDRIADNWVRANESGAVLDLPVAAATDLLTPFRFQYQSLFHGHRIVNGSSGYDSALDGFVAGPASPLLDPDQFGDALRMLRAAGVRTVVVHPEAFADRDNESETLASLRHAREQVVGERQAGRELVFPLAPMADAERSRIAGTRAAAGRLGAAIREVPKASLAADSPFARERLPYVFDGDLDSRWLSGDGQHGDERLDLRFDRPRDIAVVRIETSPRSIGNYPRRLVVEAVDGSGNARVLFDGSVLVALGNGLIAEPTREPIELWLPSNRTERLRLRQTGRSRTWFWAIDELKIYEAP